MLGDGPTLLEGRIRATVVLPIDAAVGTEIDLDAGIAVDDAVLARADLSGLTHEAELAVAKKLAEWPRLIEIAVRTNEPHRVAFYLYELAGEFHGLWNRGNDVPGLRFLQEGDSDTSQAKIALARAVSVVIASGLGILGVNPVQEMR